jgi:hypothetical protein
LAPASEFTVIAIDSSVNDRQLDARTRVSVIVQGFGINGGQSALGGRRRPASEVFSLGRGAGDCSVHKIAGVR